LGLLFVKQLVDLIDGIIQVNSELWFGAEFILTIPIKTNKLV
jgi:signal transduction histidine kinase